MAVTNPQKHITRFDKLGAVTSLACAFHCMALPLVLTFLPLLGVGFLADHRFEAAILIFTVALATFTLCWGRKIHGDHRTLHFLAVAILCFGVSHFLLSGDTAHAIFMALGGFSLAAGHMLNHRLCKHCTTCCTDHGAR